MRRFLVTDLMVIRLFTFSLSFSANFGALYFSRNVSISCKISCTLSQFFHSGLYLVSYSCYHNLPHSWWPRTTQICFLTVWRPEDRNGLKSRCQQDYAPPRVSREESIYWPFPASSPFLHLQSASSRLCLHQESSLLL